MPAAIASPIGLVSGARWFGATIKRSGFCRMNVRICSICLLSSCCASAITSFTSSCCDQIFFINSFCAARYGSALLHWLNATRYCFFSCAEADATIDSTPIRTNKTVATFRTLPPRARDELLRLAPLLHPDGRDDDDGLDHHLNVTVDVVQAEDVGQHAHDQRADDRPANASAPAGEAGPADHDGRNHVELVTHAGVRIALVRLRRVQNSRDTRQQSR